MTNTTLVSPVKNGIQYVSQIFLLGRAYYIPPTSSDTIEKAWSGPDDLLIHNVMIFF